MEKGVTVKFNGGREGGSEQYIPFPPPPTLTSSVSFFLIVVANKHLAVPVTGILKGYDALMNLVLDEGKETLRGE